MSKCQLHDFEYREIPCPDSKPGCLVAHYKCDRCVAEGKYQRGEITHNQYRELVGLEPLPEQSTPPQGFESFADMVETVRECGAITLEVNYDPEAEKAKREARFSAAVRECSCAVCEWVRTQAGYAIMKGEPITSATITVKTTSEETP